MLLQQLINEVTSLDPKSGHRSMTDAFDEQGWTRASRLRARWSTALTNAARAAGPPLLFGLRLWASVCLALYVAFWLELDNPFWAGTTAALVSTAWGFAAQGVVPHDRHLGRRRGDRCSDRVLPAGPRPVSRRSGALGRCVRSRRHASAHLCVLRGGAGRLHGCDHRSRRARGDRRPECRCGVPARSLPRQRDLHRDGLCRHRSRRDRFRRRPAPAGRVIRGPVGRNHGPVYRHAGPGWAGNAGDATRSARTRPAGQSRSTRSSTWRRENPLKSVTIRRCCRRPWTAYSPLSSAGAR